MPPESITSAQIRAARAMLGLQQEELAEIAGITRKTLAGAEKADIVRNNRDTTDSEAQPFDSTWQKIRLALEKLGIEFLEQKGARGIMLKTHQSTALSNEFGPTGPGDS